MQSVHCTISDFSPSHCYSNFTSNDNNEAYTTFSGQLMRAITQKSKKIMSLKTQVKALLKSKFSGVQLSNERVESIAKWIDSKTEKEDEIDGLLDQYNEINPLADLAKNDDRLRTLESQLKKPAAKEEEKKEDKEQEEKKVDADMPEWAKALIESNKKLSEDLVAIKAEKTVSSYKSKAEKALESVPEKLRNQVLSTIDKMKFESDEEFDSYISDWTGSVEGIKEVTFGKDKPNGGFGGLNGKEASKEELDKVMDNIQI